MVIQKEQIGYYSFPGDDVLRTKESKSLRRHELARAQILGNTMKHKVKINFYVKKRPYPVSVETTVWGVDDEFVFLKGGRVIPIKSIESIQL